MKHTDIFLVNIFNWNKKSKQYKLVTYNFEGTHRLQI